MKHFSNMVCITGASRGLGHSLAEAFWQKGANLVLIARTADALDALKEQLYIQRSPHESNAIQCIVCDLNNPEKVSELAEQLSALSIDVLINNAAIQGPIGPVWENPWSEWARTLQVNLLAPVALCRAVIPGMLKRGYGKLIQLSGGGATAARPHFSAYATAKAGLVRFNETLAGELNGSGIDANCVAPGVMSTQLLSEVATAGPEKSGEREYTLAKQVVEEAQPIPSRVIELCLYLASKKSNGISGKLISAVWDEWENLHQHQEALAQSDIYTLRRIVPNDRGQSWGTVK